MTRVMSHNPVFTTFVQLYRGRISQILTYTYYMYLEPLPFINNTLREPLRREPACSL